MTRVGSFLLGGVALFSLLFKFTSVHLHAEVPHEGQRGCRIRFSQPPEGWPR